MEEVALRLLGSDADFYGRTVTVHQVAALQSLDQLLHPQDILVFHTLHQHHRVVHFFLTPSDFLCQEQTTPPGHLGHLTVFPIYLVLPNLHSITGIYTVH